MKPSRESSRAALLLTNRLVKTDAKPMLAREFWSVVDRVEDLSVLLDLDVADLVEKLSFDAAAADRIRSLLDASTALAFERERLEEGGISLVSVFDETFPPVLRERLGTACPPFLLLAGPTTWLKTPGLGVVGSRDASDASLEAAKRSAEMAAERGWAVISGLARGVDHVTMAAALDAGGLVVGVPAEGIRRVSRNAEIRRRVHGGELCMASPFGPDTPLQAGNAMGRNKIIYALSRVTFVADSNRGSGGTWAGAKEALDKGYAPVAVWAGKGAGEGNEDLARRGATAVAHVADLFDVDPAPPRVTIRRARSAAPVGQQPVVP
ncbi:MAG TPA: DNA-processing protein DprA [Ilumatobacteraceae bacterium]|nr:DNA-processing protein DprA [Ilumatobacteraceae bacterium]